MTDLERWGGRRETPAIVQCGAMKHSIFYPSKRADLGNGSNAYIRAKIPFSWPSIPVIIPHRLRRRLRSRLRSRQSPASSLSSLQTSFSPSDTLRSLRSHRWSYTDGQYLILVILGIFSLCIIEHPGPATKTFVATLLMTALILPITRQFFLPFLPIATWLTLFFACGYVSRHSNVRRLDCSSWALLQCWSRNV